MKDKQASTNKRYQLTSANIQSTLSEEQLRSNPPRLMNVAEAATYLGVGYTTIRSRIAERKIPFVKSGGRVLFRLVDLDRWIEKQLVEAEV